MNIGKVLCSFFFVLVVVVVFFFFKLRNLLLADVVYVKKQFYCQVCINLTYKKGLYG